MAVALLEPVTNVGTTSATHQKKHNGNFPSPFAARH